MPIRLGRRTLVEVCFLVALLHLVMPALLISAYERFAYGWEKTGIMCWKVYRRAIWALCFDWALFEYGCSLNNHLVITFCCCFRIAANWTLPLLFSFSLNEHCLILLVSISLLIGYILRLKFEPRIQPCVCQGWILNLMFILSAELWILWSVSHFVKCWISNLMFDLTPSI